MSLFQTKRGGQGLINTYQFQTSVGLPDASIMFQGIPQAMPRARSAGDGTGQPGAAKERKYTPGQQRAYDAEKMNIAAERGRVQDKWINIAQQEYGGITQQFMTERKNEMVNDALGIVAMEKRLEEANAMREQNFERLNKLQEDKDFLNNIVLDNTGRTFGEWVTYNDRGVPVRTGEVGWGHIEEEGFYPMLGKDALPYLYEDDTTLTAFMDNASAYDPIKWENDMNKHVDNAVQSMISQSGTGEGFDWSNQSNIQAIQNAINTAPLLLSASNRSGALNEAIQRGPVDVVDYRINDRGQINMVPTMDPKTGKTMTIDPKKNPEAAMAQLMKDRAATAASTRVSLTRGQTLRTGSGGEDDSKIKRTPWLDVALGIGPVLETVNVTLGQRNLNRDDFNREINKFIASDERAKEIAKHRENFLSTLTSVQQNMTPRQLAIEFTRYLSEHTSGLGNLSSEAVLRGYSPAPEPKRSGLFRHSENIGLDFADYPKVLRETNVDKEHISTSLFQPSQMQNVLAGQALYQDQDGQLRFGDYPVRVHRATAEMVNSFSSGFNNMLPGAQEFLFPGANHNDLRRVVKDIEPVYEFTGKILTAPDSRGVPGMYVEVYAHLTKEQLDEITINKLTGRGTRVREESVKASRYHDFTKITNASNVGAAYGDDAKQLREQLNIAIAEAGSLYRVPMYVLLNVHHGQTFDDVINRRDEVETRYARMTQPHRMGSISETVRNLENAIIR